MKEVVDPLVAPKAGLGLRHLVVVVWEFEIVTACQPAGRLGLGIGVEGDACVDVHVIPEDVPSHHAALDVPPRAAHAPFALPTGLSWIAKGGLTPQLQVNYSELIAKSGMPPQLLVNDSELLVNCQSMTVK